MAGFVRVVARCDEGMVKVMSVYLKYSSLKHTLVKCEIHVCQFKDCKSKYETF